MRAFFFVERTFDLIDLFVCSHGFQENGLLALVLHETKNDSQVITRAACPKAVEIALEFVGFQTWLKGVGGEQREGFLNLGGNAGMSLERTSCRPDERSRFKENPRHDRISLIKSLGVVG